ncbi:Homologous-pairing protein 2 [Orchesella cincta]|uniref:Homologous-pairing protein 2 homolog n=1 Tax=Orchesella cincta TaxID=48709 RepID=A0A1D2N1C4_ORCCI|nr:Homologous-pairing protein 2 [Orchesella cincta]
MSKSKDSAESAVLQYLTSQNRPYSVNDIVLNLHKEHGKAAVQKALDTLVQNNDVREKTYGKQKVYLVDQSKLSDAGADELKQMDEKVDSLEKLCKQNQEAVKEAQAQLKMVTSSMTTDEARALVTKLTTETEELSAKYATLSAAQGEVMSKEERTKIRKDREKAVKEWKNRKRMCMDMVNTILDNSEMSKSVLLEELQVETDEDAGVKLPPI